MQLPIAAREPVRYPARVSTLLDTNVLSELLRAAPNPAVLAWVIAQPRESLCVTSVTEAAIALCHGDALATRNVSNFEDCGLSLANPWGFAAA